jgi:hypothetical protein
MQATKPQLAAFRRGDVDHLDGHRKIRQLRRTNRRMLPDSRDEHTIVEQPDVKVQELPDRYLPSLSAIDD